MTTPVATQLITRAKLSADYRIRKAYGGELAGTYAHARNADPKGVLLDKADDIQTEATRVGSLYSGDPGRFVQVEVEWDDYALGQIVTIKYPRYGLDNINGMVVARQRDLIHKTIRLTIWC